MGGGDAAIAIEQQRLRQAGRQLENLLNRVEVPQHYRIGDWMLRKVWLDGMPSLFVDGDSDRGEARVAVLLLKLHEPRHLELAARAPRCPEIEQHDPAFVIRKPHRCASGILQRQGGSRGPGVWR